MKLPTARIKLPDGTTISTEYADASRILSSALKRDVKVEKIGRGTRNASLRFASSGEDKRVFVSSEIFWLIAFVVNQNARRTYTDQTKK